jgi:cell division protein FtsA
LARKGEIVGAVDFGSRSVRVLIARQHADGGVHVLGHGVAPGRGAVQQGVIQDLGEAQAALKRALADAEREAGLRAPSLFCGVNGKNVETFIRDGAVRLDKEIVELADLEEALDQASRDVLASGKRILTSVTSQEWYVDDIRVADPVGIRGAVLKVRVHFAQVPALIEDNLIHVVESQGREMEDTVFMPLAAGLGVLTPEDMELGVAVLDLGRTNTGLILYHDRRVVMTHCFEFGGFHITRDVAAGLQVSYEEAVELILEYGIARHLIEALGGDEAAAPGADQSAHIKLKSAVRGAPSIVDRDTLDMIVFERTKELLGKVRHHLKARGHMKNLVRGVVLTGGAATIPNMNLLAETLFDAPARLGAPDGFEGMPSGVNSPEFGPVAGVLRHGFLYRAAARSGRIEVRRGVAGTIWRALGRFFSKYFF